METFFLNPGHRAVAEGDPSALTVRHSTLTEHPLFGLVGSMGFVLVTLLMLGVMGRYLLSELRLRGAGALVEADLLEREAFIDPEDPDDIRDAEWTLTYAFTVEGTRYRRAESVLPDTFVETRDLETITVRYWPPNPELARVAINERFNTGGVVALGAGILIFGGLGVIFLRSGLINSRRAQRLREVGEPVRGTVTHARPGTAFTYAFTSPQSGQRISQTLQRDETPANGTEVVVWYASDDLFQLL